SAEIKENLEKLDEVAFSHLHNHSQFSILQSTISIKDLVNAAAKQNMPAVALTDHANMMGAFHFVKEVGAYNKGIKAKIAAAAEAGEKPEGRELKAIIGCEFFVCENHKDKSRKDNGYQIVLLAKNKKGYHNLAKMSSIAYTQGFYYVPRIDKEVIK
ncbi:PHP domain-containing protein, partial [Salinimicrobium oceani]